MQTEQLMNAIGGEGVFFAAAALVAFAFLLWSVVRDRGNSNDSHVVYNYLNDSGASQSLKDRFHLINNNGRPSRKALGLLLLDARHEEADRKIAAR